MMNYGLIYRICACLGHQCVRPTGICSLKHSRLSVVLNMLKTLLWAQPNHDVKSGKSLQTMFDLPHLARSSGIVVNLIYFN